MTRPGLKCDLALLSPHQLVGYVLDPDALARRFVVELLLDWQPVALGRADLYDPDLARDGFGDGCYGFVFTVDPAALAQARRADLRLANHEAALCPPLRLPAFAPPGALQRGGEVSWVGGLRLTGWSAAAAGEAGRVRAFINGEKIAETIASRWTHVGDGRETRASRGFDLNLPARFADGCAHRVKVLDDRGRELPGSPCVFVAFPDGLANFLQSYPEIESERLRGELYDRLAPQSLPFASYADWRKRHPPLAPAEGATGAVGVALLGAAGAPESLASLRQQQGVVWVAATLNDAAGDGDGAVAAGGLSFDPAALLSFLDGDARDCETIVFAPSGALFDPAALAHFVAALKTFPSAPLAYADFSLIAADGGEWPLALPAFDYERLLEQGCGALLFAARAAYLRAALAAGAQNLFRLVNFSQDGRRNRGPRQADAAAAAAPVHIPEFLARLPRLNPAAAEPQLAAATQAHLERRGAPFKIEPGYGALLPAVRVRRTGARGKVSILIPTRDRVDLLKPCIDSLFATIDVSAHEILILDNDSAEAETLAYFEQVSARGVRVRRVGGAFNFSRIVNAGAAIASGDLLLLLNNDVEARQPGWLEEMIARMAEPDVGAVGATLIWPSGVVQHGGVALGQSFAAAHIFNDRIEADPGYADLLRAAHEVSAATAACLLTERRLFHDVGGFDGMHFPINFNDVDYCLKLRARGLRIVQTPHARLLHRESASRGLDKRADQRDRLQRELRNLRAVWGEVLVADPAYNPQLSLDFTPFTALAWPPRPRHPRQPFTPPPRILPPGF